MRACEVAELTLDDIDWEDGSDRSDKWGTRPFDVRGEKRGRELS